MRLRLRVPRPEHQSANPEEQEAWKKKLATVVEQVQKDHAIAAVEVLQRFLHKTDRPKLHRHLLPPTNYSDKVCPFYAGSSLVWCEDEHRIGLQPVMRRLWVEFGEQPVAVVNWKREWLWLYAFVQPQTGETYWWILPYVNTKLFSRVLKDEAQHFGAGKDKRIILPLDQAGWHYE